MKKITLVSAAVAALGLTAVAAFAADPRDERWEQLDANGDGELSVSEMSARQAEMVEKADADGNGSLSREEMKTWRSS